MTKRNEWVGFASVALVAALLCMSTGCAAFSKSKTQKPAPAVVGKPVTTPVDSTTMQQKKPEPGADRTANLSAASQLMVRTCDNYLTINPQNQKCAEVLVLKASLYYNNKLFDEARVSYKAVLDRFPKDIHAIEAIRMTAQTFYEEKKFDEAQVWYRKLKESAVDGTDRAEAITRIAESIFKLGESYEAENKLRSAATEYERVALEFPEAKIADAALFNAGLVYEKLSEWSQAILQYQKLAQKYATSKLLAKAHFRSAKGYEKLTQWNDAGETYLRVVANFPQSELAQTSMYNAGFCFENAEKLPVAAATFEKMAQLYPQSDDAPDVLFRAGEIFGKLKDWASVTRVNQEFTRRFGNDANRVVQAQCMVGVALYMQNLQTAALDQLVRAIATYGKLKNPSTTNRYYAAKAEFTIGEIKNNEMNAIVLVQPKDVYKRLLVQKSALLDEVIGRYSQVIKYQISEWTTRSIFSIAKGYEDFAVSVFKQQRPSSMSMDERIALELGIAQAVEEYFVNKAAHYYEENVKLGIKEKIEDKYVLDSRQKLTSLPYLAGENYLKLVEIVSATTQSQKLEGFAAIAKKLETLQKIGPFQERAIALFMTCLENGSRYRQTDESYAKASGSITKTAFTVGQTYADIATTAREAPIPSTFDPYEAFVYKTKLLKQIEPYEDKSQENLLRAVKIAEAYKIEDESVRNARIVLPRVLYVRARIYDVLCQGAFQDPPFPKATTDAEREEYRERFEEIGIKFEETAFDAYRTILAYAKQNFATGEYVNHAYVRLFQKYPKEFGVKVDKLEDRVLVAGPEWKCSPDTTEGWAKLEYADTAWKQAQKAILPTAVALSGFPEKSVLGMWYGEGDPKGAQYVPSKRLALRRVFYNYDALKQGTLWAAGIDDYTIMLNEKELLPTAADTLDWTKAKKWDMVGKLRDGKNVLAVYVRNNIRLGYAFIPYMAYTVSTFAFVPQPPGAAVPLAVADVSPGTYRFPAIVNFAAPVIAAGTKK